MVPDEGAGRQTVAAIPLKSLRENPRQRRILQCLLRLDYPVHVSDLAALLAHVDAKVDGRQPSEDDVESEKCTLYHYQLPRLDEAGVVSFDPETKLVALDT